MPSATDERIPSHTMTPPNPAANWTDDIIGLTLPDAPVVPLPKSNWLDHTLFVSWLIGRTRPRRIAEIGVYTGASLLLMRALAEYHGIADAQLAGVDPWDGRDGGVATWVWDGDETFNRLRDRCASYANVLLIRAEGSLATAAFEPDSIDLLHIDADHREASVRADLATWLPNLAPNGIVLLHDVCNFTKVCQVWKVWGEITAEHPSCTHVSGSGLGAFAPKGVPPGLEQVFRIY